MNLFEEGTGTPDVWQGAPTPCKQGLAHFALRNPSPINRARNVLYLFAETVENAGAPVDSVNAVCSVSENGAAIQTPYRSNSYALKNGEFYVTHGLHQTLVDFTLFQ